MALKFIPESWRDDMRTRFDHGIAVYIDPRRRVVPALTSAGISWIANTKDMNLRGTYRMQCGASTDLTYLYRLSERFILEGWFRPEFNYNVAADQFIFGFSSIGARLKYDAADDRYEWYITTSGGPAYKSTSAFTTNEALQRWTYVRAWFDNAQSKAALYMLVNGVDVAGTSGVTYAGTFSPADTITFLPTVAAESSYWIIHELDEAIAAADVPTYEADRQVMWDFDGTTLGRERIPVTSRARSVSLSKSVQSRESGAPCANSAGVTLHNHDGRFSDDQYAAFDPAAGSYNGTAAQRYLRNRAGIEIESAAPSETVRKGLIAHWSFDAGDGADDSGNGYTATLDGCVADTGISAGGMLFDGANDYAYGTHPDFTTYSLAVWYKGTDPGGAYGVTSTAKQLLSTSRNATIGIKAALHIQTGGVALARQISAAGSNVVATSAAAINDGAWHHICSTYDATTLRLYVDGAIADSVAATLTSDYDGRVRMMRNYSTTYVAGTIDEPRMYNRALTASEVLWLYQHPGDWGATSRREPLFIGRTAPGAFRRSSPSSFYGSVSVQAEDGVSELGEMRLRNAVVYDSHDLSKPSAEADSLFHSIARLSTLKEIRNYALNSSFENATIGDSWTASGLTLTRDNTYALFGTYSAKAVSAGTGEYLQQVVAFEGDERIDVGDKFNFSAWVRQGTASTVKVMIEELDTSDTLLGTASETACGTVTAEFIRVDVGRTILDATCTKLRVTIQSTGASTFYADGAMLTRGIDPIDWFVANANDGASGEGTADDYTAGTYDSVAFDADAVAVTHPYAFLDADTSPWEALRKIGDASISRYLGMTPDGALALKVAYNATDPDNLGDIEDGGGMSSQVETETANAIKVHGVVVVEETAPKLVWSAEASGLFLTDIGSKCKHPIDDGDPLELNGATVIEATYSEMS